MKNGVWEGLNAERSDLMGIFDAEVEKGLAEWKVVVGEGNELWEGPDLMGIFDAEAAWFEKGFDDDDAPGAWRRGSFDAHVLDSDSDSDSGKEIAE